MASNPRPESEVKREVLTKLVELARFGAVLQDNPDRAKVLNQFAYLMQSYIPEPSLETDDAESR